MNFPANGFAGLRTVEAPHFLRDSDLTGRELHSLLNLARQVKMGPEFYRESLKHRSIALLFEKPSLRTRMTFQVAAGQLGGFAVFQDHRDGLIGEREPARDIARNLDRWFDAIVARTYAHKTLELLAKWSKVPVINALSESYHPCQALADYLTLLEHFGTFEGLKIAYVGDANNVAHSLMHCAAQLGVSITICGPPEYGPREADLAAARAAAKTSGSAVEVLSDIRAAVRDAAAVYTDVWTSMGWEQETQQRRIAFQDYEITPEVMAAARDDAVFMHCLPALRGQEVSDAVIESARSLVFDQAENRLHAHKALLLMMVGGA